MNNRTVAHEWANQTRKAAGGSNFYFEGAELFSYGRHFTVGMIVERKTGGNIALLNSRSYSVSTSKHQGYARAAVSHLTRFNVPAVGISAGAVAENYAYYLEEIGAAQEKFIRARTAGEIRERALKSIIAEAGRYIIAFPDSAIPGAKQSRAAIRAWVKRAETGELVSEKDRAAVKLKMEKARAANAAREKEKAERRAADRVKAEAVLSAWVSGASDDKPGYTWGSELPTMLRVKGPAVETSRGAVVSTRAARVLWARIKAGKDVIGAEIEGYTVTGFNGELKIGCHSIARAEVERLGSILDSTEAE